MEATADEALIPHDDQFVVPPNGNVNEMLNVDHEDNMQGQVSSADFRKPS